MATESSPICFRVPADERSLLEVVARHQGQTLSAFVRDAVVRVAQGLIEEYGAEAVFKTFETTETQRAEEARARVDEFRARLLSQHRGSSD
ncbi:MAG TPA: DUF1778 domain-containing protein [Pseudonocardiaceae bacterium]|nr:DUF1778 domain-containing protein [Pseudonocardiaceae bacterium]